MSNNILEEFDPELKEVARQYMTSMRGVEIEDLEEIEDKKSPAYRGAFLHEYTEVRELLDMGYEEEEIRNNEIKKPDYNLAHETATLRTNNFYRELAKEKMGKDIPEKAFMLVYPGLGTWELLGNGGRINALRKEKERIESQEISTSEVEDAINFFEAPEEGVIYHNKEEILEIAERYMEDGPFEDVYSLDVENRELADFYLPFGT